MKFISNSNDLSKFLEKSIKKNIKIKSISTDTRTLKKDSLFVAIRGNIFDGNDYVEDALKKGSCLVITDNKKFKDSKNKKVIYVNSSLLALKKITKNIIKHYEGNIIGITGSNGKTTTTKIIANSLKSCSSTLKNFNNEIGMPLSILNANPKSKNLVIEMGAAKPKDIHYLSSILNPNVGLITNIGNSHLENLINTQGVLNVKSELVPNIKHNGFLVVPNENLKHLKFWRNIRSDIHIRTFGLKSNADFYPRNIVMDSNKTEFKICSKKYNLTIPISTTLLGDHNVKNILEETLNKKISAKIVHVPHHIAHISSSYFISGLDDAIGLTVDGSGDFSTSESFILENNSVKGIEKVFYPHSLGIFYQTFTQFLGFQNYGDEYKVMGLSSYGEPKYINRVKKVISYDKNGNFKKDK